MDSDSIEPVRIEHKVDEIIADGLVEQSYNYLDYQFDSPAGAIHVRSYLNTSHAATIHPPVGLGDGKLLFGEDWTARDAIIAYLTRRFLVIKELSLAGYQPIWIASHAREFLASRGEL